MSLIRKKKKMAKLNELPEGVLGEIISLENENIFMQVGAHVGMSVVVLKKAAKSIVEIGFHQQEISEALAKKITVCYEQ